MFDLAQRCVMRVLTQLLPADVADALIGDLLEERAALGRVAGSGRAAMWYWGQLVMSMLPLLHAALRRREFAVALAVGFVAYAFAVTTESAAREAVALVATDTAVDAIPVLLVYLPTLVLAAYVAERARAGAAFSLGLFVALSAVIQLIANVQGMPLWYRLALPVAGPMAALAGHALSAQWSRRAAAPRRRRSIA
jgi:hypothetical protein